MPKSSLGITTLSLETLANSWHNACIHHNALHDRRHIACWRFTVVVVGRVAVQALFVLLEESAVGSSVHGSAVKDARQTFSHAQMVVLGVCWSWRSVWVCDADSGVGSSGSASSGVAFILLQDGVTGKAIAVSYSVVGTAAE